MDKASVVVVTIEGREELLERSLWCYVKQTHSPLEVIVVADRPETSRTEELVQAYQSILDVKYVELKGEPGWRGPGYALNKGISESSGKVIINSCSEILMEFDAIEKAVKRLNGQDKKCAMIIHPWISQELTEWMRTNPQWRRDVSMLRKLVVSPINEGSDLVRPSFVEDAKSTLNLVRLAPDGVSPTMCSVMTKWTWDWMGGFTLYDHTRSMDADFIKRKRALDINQEMIVSSAAYHQWHPVGAKTRKIIITEYKNPEDARQELRWE